MTGQAGLTTSVPIPIEHEIQPYAHYVCNEHPLMHGVVAGINLERSSRRGCEWFRLGRAARYVPETAEPTGLGAVVRDGNDIDWIRNARATNSHSDTSWRAPSGAWRPWSALTRPVTVLSHGCPESLD